MALKRMAEIIATDRRLLTPDRMGPTGRVRPDGSDRDRRSGEPPYHRCRDVGEHRLRPRMPSGVIRPAGLGESLSVHLVTIASSPLRTVDA